jgi:hypothetical protein
VLSRIADHPVNRIEGLLHVAASLQTHPHPRPPERKRCKSLSDLPYVNEIIELGGISYRSGFHR